MGDNMIPYTLAVGDRYTNFTSTNYKFIGNDKIQEGTLLNPSNGSMDPYDYHLSKNGLDCFRKLLECKRIHSSWPDMQSGFKEEVVEDEEDVGEDFIIHELEYTDGSNEVVKIFNQKYVICLERDSEYKFTQCSHQCFCEDFYQKKGYIDILNCVVC